MYTNRLHILDYICEKIYTRGELLWIFMIRLDIISKNIEIKEE